MQTMRRATLTPGRGTDFVNDSQSALSRAAYKYSINIPLHWARRHFLTLHHTTLHYTTLHQTTLHYTTPHYATLNYTGLYKICTQCFLTFSDTAQNYNLLTFLQFLGAKRRGNLFAIFSAPKETFGPPKEALPKAAERLLDLRKKLAARNLWTSFLRCGTANRFLGSF